MGHSTSHVEPAGSAQRILEAGIELLARDGEAGLRVIEVADRAGVSVGTIYTHFDSRDGLIEDVYLEQYRRLIGEYLMPLHRVVGADCTREDILRSLEEATALGSTSLRAANSVFRAETLGASRRRPNLAQAIQRENQGIAQLEIAAAREAQDAGLLDANLDVEALVGFIQGLLFGLALLDVDDSEQPSPDRWREMLRTFFDAAFIPPT